MTAPDAPKLDTRRTEQFFAELRQRAQAWIPSWGFADNEGDFGGALLQIAARFNSEVAQRLDRAGEKMRRGLLDWLAVRGQAARPSRMPVVFKLADTATETVLAKAPVQMQAPAGDVSVVFETEKDINILPGSLRTIVAVDGDKFYLPPPGLSDLEPLTALPTEWQLKSFAAANSTKLQLEPEAGLEAGMIVAVGGAQYTIVAAGNGIVTIDPPLAADLSLPATIRKVSTFAPFDPGAHNAQEHVLYLGHTDVLNIDAEATIDVVGATTLADGVKWEFWGTLKDTDDPSWLPLTIVGPAATPARVVLHKPKGKVVPRDINEVKSRWIRAFATSVDPAQTPFSVDSVTLRINCTDATTPGGTAKPIDVSATAEAMDNTTPIVLNSVFFPLGKAPRQFDSFYLGSPEAFSKVGAKVQLEFTMAEASFFTLSAVREGAFADRVLAGVGADNALHLLAIDPVTGGITKFPDREPLQPPVPGYAGAATTGANVTLDKEPRYRLPVWRETDAASANPRFAVATIAGKDVWVWLEREDNSHQSGWVEFGPLPTTTSDAVASLVYLSDPLAPLLVAVQGQNLWIREWTEAQPPVLPWAFAPTTDPAPVTLKALVPILDLAGLVTSAANDLVGVSDGNELYTVTLGGACTSLGPTDADFDVPPIAVLNAPNDLIVVYAQTGLNAIVVVREGQPDVTITLTELDASVAGLEAFLDGASQVEFLASVVHASGSYTLTWAPTTGGTAPILSRTDIPAAAGTPGGAPTLIDKRIVVPGDQANLLAASFDVANTIQQTATILGGIVLPASGPTLAPNDQVARTVGTPELCTIGNFGTTRNGEVFYPTIAPFFTTASTGPILAYLTSTPRTGTPTGTVDEFSVDPADHEMTDNSFVLVNSTLFQISLDKTVNPWVATATGLGNPAAVTYFNPILTGGRAAPYMELDPAGNGNWPATLLDRTPLTFPSENPTVQPAKAFATDVAGHPTIVALLNEFAPAPAAAVTFVINGAIGAWQQMLGDSSANPELSWEYSNGRSWSKLSDAADETRNLKNSGAVKFTVPADIAQSDWSGKSDFWIRARLIGGDYGQEKVTVKTKPLPDGSTEQTVVRSSEGIRAPSVVRLEIFYSICNAVLPEAVLAQDSGTTLDETDANRTGGALVEAFVPLPLALQRLSNAPPSTENTANCLPDCNCRSCVPAATTKDKATASKAAGASSTAQTATSTQRALFIGLKTVASGGSVNVLLLVDEREHSQFTSLTVEALIENEFQPITASDATRAIGESGLLTLAFELVPTEAELFGQSLTWLRLTPHGTDLSDWKPSIRGAYLNGMWASATETLTRELVGSSEGAPNLKLTLARPPLLESTLELRVREPLGDEEVKQLADKDKNLVKTNPDQLAGNWVLWTQVDDPLDAGPQDRVYSLDETTGEIQFGDGLHGMIPPIGTDSIVAFRYQRTEPAQPGSDAIPGNEVESRTVLGLVSPLPTVETVTAADQSAGGTLAEADDRVVQFGFARLRHRDRAVTAADIEDLVLAMSPDIAQARCLLKRGSARLVVVKRGADPTPSNAEVREWTRLLLTLVPSSLSTSKAVSIVKPTLRALRIYMRVVVDSLDNAGAFRDDAQAAIASLLDPSTGRAPKAGWLLGASPIEDDIALALIDTAHLESIAEVTFREVAPDGTERPWPSTLLPTELAVLDDDPVRIEFELVGAAA